MIRIVVVNKPRTVLGVNVMPVTLGARTVIFAEWLKPLARMVAVTVTVSVCDTTAVVIGKIAEVWPAGTTTGLPPFTVTEPELSGGFGSTLPLVMLNGTPPAGAGPVNVIVKFAPCPPSTLFGLIETEKSTGLIVNCRLIGAPPRDAEIVAMS